MTDLYLGLGSNLGNRQALLTQAIQLLTTHVGPCLQVSAFIHTRPWGFSSPHPFLNAAAHFHTSLTPQEVLLTTQRIEQQLGRTHKSSAQGYADRPIDIDILLYGPMVAHLQVCTPTHTQTLILPHPLMHQRWFVMQPLAQIAPQLIHPTLHLTMQELLHQLPPQDE